MLGFEENEINKNAFGGTELIARHLASVIKPELLENCQIVSSRVRELQQDKIRIMYFHDLPNDPEAAKFKDASTRDKFHHFVFISNWQYQQYQQYLGFPWSDKCSVIEVGFDPIEPHWDWKTAKDKPTRFCYTSTPQRGLNILVPVFAKLAEKYGDEIQLSVFSSFKIYGWEESDKQFEPLYDQIRNHPQMIYHGFTPHEELIEFLQNADIFAYPCIWPETSCRAMEEAMSAGLMCVHSNFAALPETSGGVNFMYDGDSNPNIHANLFYNKLEEAYLLYRDDYSNIQKHLKFVKEYADRRYSIDLIRLQWQNVLEKLNKKYPTLQSRKIEDQFLIIDTNKR